MFKANKGRHSVYSLTVHLIFVCKRRGKVFDDERLMALQTMFDKVLDDFEAELLEFNGEEDHVHLLVSYPPKHSIAAIVNSLKGVSSRRLKEQFPAIESFWSVAKSKNALWSPSYFASSTGGAPIEVLKRYIQEQNRPD
jgi:putative transposase